MADEGGATRDGAKQELHSSFRELTIARIALARKDLESGSVGSSEGKLERFPDGMIEGSGSSRSCC